jgi:hypothetical protein
MRLDKLGFRVKGASTEGVSDLAQYFGDVSES